MTNCEKTRESVTVQDRSERNRVDRENMIQECGNPIVEDDFLWIFASEL